MGNNVTITGLGYNQGRETETLVGEKRKVAAWNRVRAQPIARYVPARANDKVSTSGKHLVMRAKESNMVLIGVDRRCNSSFGEIYELVLHRRFHQVYDDVQTRCRFAGAEVVLSSRYTTS
jgi:hypothetical protein